MYWKDVSFGTIASADSQAKQNFLKVLTNLLELLGLLNLAIAFSSTALCAASTKGALWVLARNMLENYLQSSDNLGCTTKTDKFG